MAQKAGERTAKTNYLCIALFSDHKLNKIVCILPGSYRLRHFFNKVGIPLYSIESANSDVVQSVHCRGVPSYKKITYSDHWQVFFIKNIDKFI